VTANIDNEILMWLATI